MKRPDVPRLSRRSCCAGLLGDAAGGSIVGVATREGTHGGMTVAAESDTLAVEGVAADIDGPPSAIPITAEGTVSFELDQDVEEVGVDLLASVDDGPEEELDFQLFFSPDRSGKEPYTIHADLYDSAAVSESDFELDSAETRTYSITLVIEAAVRDGGEVLESTRISKTVEMELREAGIALSVDGEATVEVEQ